MDLRPAAVGLLALATPLAHAQGSTLTLTPLDSTTARFGEAVAVVPDTDGDGVADLVVGSPNEEVDGAPGGVGRVYVFSGATGDLRFRIQPPEPARTLGFGEALAGVPDADGDGAGDILVGVPSFTVPGRPDRNTVGRAYLFSGATGALLRTLDTPVPDFSNHFGEAVAGLPDVDGDGRGDLAVGAPNEFDPQGDLSAYGHVYVVSGASGGLLRTIGAPELAVSNPGLAFGAAVASVPDVDGDGTADVVVGAPGFRPGTATAQRSNGRAYVLSGATGAVLRTLDTEAPEFEGVFGTAVAGVPDADGDGRGDVLVGAPGEDVDGLSNAGRAYLFSGATGALLRPLPSPVPRAGGGFGRAVAGIGDLDGDGRGDLAVGARSEYLNVTDDPGRVHVLSGATGALVTTLRGRGQGNPIRVPNYGWSVAGVPDLDGDGRAEVFVGAPEQRVGSRQTGTAFVYRSGVSTAASGETGAGPLALVAAPNPVGGRAAFAYVLDRPGAARLAVYDALGREVAVVVGGDLPVGRGEATLDVARLAPGGYLARLEAGGGATTVRFTVIR